MFDVIQEENSLWQIAKELARGKKSEKYFLAEGSKTVKSLLASFQPLALFTSASFQAELYGLEGLGTKPEIISDKLWANFSSTSSPVKLVGLFERFYASEEHFFAPNPEAQTVTHTLILDAVQDPGNVGTILRTATATGCWSRLVLAPETADPFSLKVIRACAGHLGQLKILRLKSIDFLKQELSRNNYELVLLDPHSKECLSNFKPSKPSKPLALVLSREGQGLAEHWADFSGALRLALPMSNNAESLNVAVAGALAMYKLGGLL